MKILIAILVSGLLLLAFDKKIKKYNIFLYCATAALTAFAYWMPSALPDILKQFFRNYVTSGVISATLFVIVMFAIVCPKGSRLQKCFMSNRGEIAIIASIMAWGHIVYYGLHYVKRIFSGTRILSENDILMSIIGLLLFLLLIPLWITSFKKIRRKMKPKKWKQLQRFSYLFYALIYLHIAVAFLPSVIAGRTSRIIDFYCYTLVFGTYAVMRVGKYLKKTSQKNPYPALTGIFAACLVGISLWVLPIGGISKIQAQTENETEAQTNTEAEVQAVSDEAREEESEANEESVAAAVYQDGTWTGEGMGFNGMIKVEVTIEDSKITAIKVIEREDDEPYFTDARTAVTARILEQQTADVDGVTGASYSSQGLKDAVRDALKKAEVETAVNTVMGTDASIRIFGESGYAAELFGMLDDLEAEVLSWRIEGSEIYNINHYAIEENDTKDEKTQNGYAMSEKLENYLKAAWQLSEDTDGAFDLTVGGISKLWSLGTDEARIPDQSEIDEQLLKTGFQYASFTEDRIVLENGVQLDLGAIGKGIGCQEIEDYLENTDAYGAVAAIGGSILLYGEKADGTPWKVAITNPREETGSAYLGTLTLDGTWAVSTSGDYEKYLMEEDIRYHHIIDPKTGYPAQSGLISVTIVCKDGWLSDALSTACFVLGYEQSLAVLEKYEAEAVFVDSDFNVYVTKGLENAFELSGQFYKRQG